MSPRSSDETLSLFGPPVLAISLLATLLPLPRPAMTAALPWKVELLVSLILCVVAGKSLRRVWSSDIGWRPIAHRFPIALLLSFTVFVFWSLMSALWAFSPYSALHHSFIWFSYIVIFAATLFYLERSRSISLVTSTFVWLIAVIGTLCIIDYLTMPDFQTAEGPLRIRYGKHAELIVTILPVVWMAGLYARRKRRSAALTTVAAVGWLVVMLSLSKGAFIAGIIGFVTMAAGGIFFGYSSFRKRLILSVGVWLTMTVLVQASFSVISGVPSTTNYITGSADGTRDTSMMRVFTWNVTKQMVVDNWLGGVGADNFGVSFNKAREAFREAHPKDTSKEFGEDYTVDRAHNEPLQVASELGVIGLLLFSIPFLLIFKLAVKSFFHCKLKLSPMAWACIGGAASFAVSSAFSSFSFRAVQNGIVFFLVIAVAVHSLRKRRPEIDTPRIPLTYKNLRWAAAVVCGVLVIQTAFFGAKGAAECLVINAGTVSDHNEANRMFDIALRLDPDYSALHLLSALRSSKAGDHADAALRMRRAVDQGVGVPSTYSTFANLQYETGGPEKAGDTLTEAIKIFPRSVFLRARYAVLLENSGKFGDADIQLRAARSVDPRQAAGWYNLLRKGGLEAYLESRNAPDTAMPAELVPASVVPGFLDGPVQVAKNLGPASR